MITKRYARANNPGCGRVYNPNKELSYLIYLDANNLYGWAMSQFLPTGGFRWMTSDEINGIEETILELRDEADDGYILEVDLLYPEELHDGHNDYPWHRKN